MHKNRLYSLGEEIITKRNRKNLEWSTRAHVPLVKSCGGSEVDRSASAGFDLPEN